MSLLLVPRWMNRLFKTIEYGVPLLFLAGILYLIARIALW